MSWKEMQVVPTKSGGLTARSFEYEESLIAAGNGNAIVVPDDIQSVSVQVEPSGGCTVKVQATIDRLDTVQNGSPVWVDWDLGEVPVNTQNVCDPVTAIRLIQVGTGSSKIKVRAQ